MGDRPVVPERPRRHGALLGLLSALVPGAGQLLARRRGAGLALLAAWLLPAALAAAAIVDGGAPAIGRIADARLLAAVVGANVALLVVRAVAALHAPAAGRAPGVAGWLAIAAAVLGLGAANGAVAWYAWQGYDTVTTVFAEAEPEVAEPVGGGVLAPASPAPAASAADAPAPAPSVAATAAPAGTTASAPPTARLEEAPAPAGPPWRRRGRVTLLLLGGDAGFGRSGLRTDSMVVVTLDLRSGFAALFSVPRNAQRVPLSGVLAERLGPVFEPLLNELYDEARAHPEWFPKARDPGAAALKQTLADLTGLPIDYYALVDLKGFYEVVRAFGGVDVVVPERVLDRVSPPSPELDWIRIDLQPGLQHLDAAQTFAYVRARSQSSDWSRIRRQRCVLAALAADATPRRVLRILPGLLRTLRDNVTTDIPRGVLPDLVDLAAGLDRRHVLSFGFVPPDYTVGGAPDVAAIQALVRSVVEHPAGRPFESAAGDACRSA